MEVVVVPEITIKGFVFISYRHGYNIWFLPRKSIWNKIKKLPGVVPQPLLQQLQDSSLRCQSVCQKLESCDNWYLILICGIIYQLISQ